ncbi:unnamed protein product [Cylicocyclus nassatus]|uniref:Uncharacterized protein n=1 Tax=Cylicocyclus nassatus TaxID=53992 RepID=A0AA36GJU7_CYLNA|nr:unnamed protein product [Cylicocyclus nassatus]
MSKYTTPYFTISFGANSKSRKAAHDCLHAQKRSIWEEAGRIELKEKRLVELWQQSRTLAQHPLGCVPEIGSLGNEVDLLYPEEIMSKVQKRH